MPKSSSIRLAVSIEQRLVTDRWTNRYRHRAIASTRASIGSRGKNRFLQGNQLHDPIWLSIIDDEPRTWECRRRYRLARRWRWIRRTCSRRASWWTDRRRSVWVDGGRRRGRRGWCCCQPADGLPPRAPAAAHTNTITLNSRPHII